MRRLLFILPFVIPGAALAQSQAANPVTPFSEGQRVGTSSNPIMAALSSAVPSASASSGQAATPVELYSYGRRVGTSSNPLYVNLGNALSGYLTQSQAAQTYLPLSGGNTTGPLNGVNFFDGLVGSSASGATVTLTTDRSGTLNGSNCLQVPPFGVTNLDITAVGVSSNGTDAVMQKFDGMAVFSSDGTPMMSQAGTIINAYPSFGSPGSWSVVASVDGATKCISVTTKAGGSGSWKWRASIHYENFQP